MSAVTLYVLFGALAAGFVQGLSGFAFGLVAMTFWVWVIPPQLAGPLVVFGSLLIMSNLNIEMLPMDQLMKMQR